jgi:hypothetical protein
MRTAIQIQSRTGHILPKMLLNARDGIDFPLSETELQLELKKIK